MTAAERVPDGDYSVVACDCHRGPWRWPKHHRRSFPVHWIVAFSWRQVSIWTPKIAKRSALVTVRIWPRYGGWLLGVYVGKDDDGEVVIRLGAGVAEVEIMVMEWVR